MDALTSRTKIALALVGLAGMLITSATSVAITYATRTQVEAVESKAVESQRFDDTSRHNLEELRGQVTLLREIVLRMLDQRTARVAMAGPLASFVASMIVAQGPPPPDDDELLEYEALDDFDDLDDEPSPPSLDDLRQQLEQHDLDWKRM